MDSGRITGRRAGRREAWIGSTSLLVVLFLLGSATAALAHLALISTTPSEGERLARVPSAIELYFTEPVELPLFLSTVTGPAGPVPVGPVEDVEGRQRVRVPIAGPIVAGSYTVTWQAVGRDGHPVRGDFAFEVEPDAEGIESAAAPVGESPATPVAPPAPLPTLTSQSPLFAGIRWMAYLGIVGSVGAVGFAMLLRSRRLGAAGLGDAFIAGALRGAAALGVLAAMLVVVSLPLRLQAQSHALFGAGITADRFSLLLSSGWGVAWVIQAAGALLTLGGFALLHTRAAPGLIVAAAGSLGLVLSPALSGHAAAVDSFRSFAILAQAGHILAVSVWLGTLFAILAVGIPRIVREPPGPRATALRALLAAFSPIALAAGAIVVLTGVFAASMYLDRPSDLFASSYGRLLTAKLFLVAIVLGLGAFNWKVSKPRAASPGGEQRLVRAASAEIVAAILIIALTAVLVAVPPPAHRAAEPSPPALPESAG